MNTDSLSSPVLCVCVPFIFSVFSTCKCTFIFFPDFVFSLSKVEGLCSVLAYSLDFGV